MAGRRTRKTVRLDATITNPRLESPCTDERALPAPKRAAADLAVSELLNTLRETGGRDDVALLELQTRYDTSIARSLRKYDIRDWNDRQTITSDVWQKAIRVVLIPPGSRGAWNRSRSRRSDDPFRPLLDAIVRSKAIDFHRACSRGRKRFADYAEDVGRFGADVAALSETSRAARSRLLGCLRPTEAEPIAAPLTRRLAGRARGGIATAVEGLPEPLRRVLLLKASGRRCCEIALHEGISRGEASKRLKRARLLVAALLADPAKAG